MREKPFNRGSTDGTALAFQVTEACARNFPAPQEEVMFEKKSLARRRAEEPYNVLRQMTTELDRMFDEPWTLFRWPSDRGGPEIPTWAPKVDVVTKDSKLITRVDLPGMKKDDVLVQVEDGYLTLTGERTKETKEEQDNVYREEREYGSFCRTVPLPKGVKADDIKATFTNGVLEVTVPLPAAAESKTRRIPVQDAAAPAKTAA
jgi:HSP20 family protein